MTGTNTLAYYEYDYGQKVLNNCASMQIEYKVYRENTLDRIYQSNWDKSADRLCFQVAAWVSNMFCNFYLVKSHKIEARVKIRTEWESLEF